jgi:hypothetical protein
MSIDKAFAGDLVGTSQGEMLFGGSPAEGSAGYVAIERVTGALQGRSGSFLLQNSGTAPDVAGVLSLLYPSPALAEGPFPSAMSRLLA